MEHYEISKLSNYLTMSKFETRMCIEVNDLKCGQYSTNKNLRFKIPILRSDLCDYSELHIVVKGRVSVTSTNNANKRTKS